MRSALVVLISLLAAGTAAAQESARYKLEPHSINAGGNPATGSAPASAHYKVRLDAIGDSFLSVELSSGSFLLDAGLAGSLPFAPGAAAGRVGDDGCSLPGAPVLTTTRNAGSGDITLTWGASCLGTDSDYEVYQGNLGSFYSHSAKICSTGGLLTTTFPDPNPALGYYYLVVPTNGLREGSYGAGRTAACGSERPAGSVQCEPRQVGACP